MNRIALLVCSLLLSACQPPAAPRGGAAGEAASVAVGALSVENPQVRPPLGGQTTGAAYLVIRNTGNETDRLVAARSTAAGVVEIHTHRAADGVMRMERVDFIDIPAHGAVVFEPRGLHLMLFDLKADGASVPITLQFAKAGEATVSFAVAPLGAASPRPDHAGMGH
ncbi:MAG: copper chaperone PCu(A)C [Hyphomonadaceae bacterium]|nr:copper chaperone PCu(A)C [Hyphomonadaceae bacterium]